MTGLSIVLTIIVINSIVAFIISSSTAAPNIAGCTTTDNFTTCQSVSKTSFLGSLFAVTVSGIPGVPDIINLLYVLIAGGLLIGGIIMMVIALVPTLGF
jgi:hypothetical protein